MENMNTNLKGLKMKVKFGATTILDEHFLTSLGRKNNPVDSVVVESDPVESDPVENDFVENDPVENDPVGNDHI